MYPQEQGNNLNPQANQGRKLLALGAGVLILFALVFFVFSRGSSPKTGTGGAAGGKQGSVLVQYQLADTSGATVYFNGTKTKAAKGTTYDVNPASYTLKITKAGYKDFSVKFNIGAGQTIAVNVILQPLVAATADLTTTNQIAYLPDNLAASSTIISTEYFYNQTWAVLKVSTPDDPNLLWFVAQFQADQQGWVSVTAPTVVFDTTTAATLPLQIQQYLNDNNAVGTED